MKILKLQIKKLQLELQKIDAHNFILISQKGGAHPLPLLVVNPLLPSVANMRSSAKILILI